jgi:hypothetical protein
MPGREFSVWRDASQANYLASPDNSLAIPSNHLIALS